MAIEKTQGLGTAAPMVQEQRRKLPNSRQPEVVAQQFEALLVEQMIDSMWSTIPKNGLISGSNEEATFRDMFNEALAGSISEGRGLGIKDVILKDLKKGSR